MESGPTNSFESPKLEKKEKKLIKDIANDFIKKLDDLIRSVSIPDISDKLLPQIIVLSDEEFDKIDSISGKSRTLGRYQAESHQVLIRYSLIKRALISEESSENMLLKSVLVEELIHAITSEIVIENNPGSYVVTCRTGYNRVQIHFPNIELAQQKLQVLTLAGSLNSPLVVKPGSNIISYDDISENYVTAESAPTHNEGYRIVYDEDPHSRVDETEWDTKIVYDEDPHSRVDETEWDTKIVVFMFLSSKHSARSVEALNSLIAGEFKGYV